MTEISHSWPTQVPLIIRAPWLWQQSQSQSQSQLVRAARSSALVELVDLLPTIAALAGLSLPPAAAEGDESEDGDGDGAGSFDGVSLVPLLTVANATSASTSTSVEHAEVEAWSRPLTGKFSKLRAKLGPGLGLRQIAGAWGGDGEEEEEVAFSQYPRKVRDPNSTTGDDWWHGNSIIHHDRRQFTHMGYSVRTR